MPLLSGVILAAVLFVGHFQVISTPYHADVRALEATIQGSRKTPQKLPCKELRGGTSPTRRARYHHPIAGLGRYQS